MFRLLVSSRSSRVSLFGVVVATVHQALNARVRETRASVISPLLSLFSLSSLSLSLSLSLTHTHTRRTQTPLTTRQHRGAQRVAPWPVPTHAGAFVQSFVKKSSKLCVYLFIY